MSFRLSTYITTTFALAVVLIPVCRFVCTFHYEYMLTASTSARTATADISTVKITNPADSFSVNGCIHHLEWINGLLYVGTFDKTFVYDGKKVKAHQGVWWTLSYPDYSIYPLIKHLSPSTWATIRRGGIPYIIARVKNEYWLINAETNMVEQTIEGEEPQLIPQSVISQFAN